MKKHTLLTNDVETTSIWFNTLRYKTAARVLKEGMPALLDIYSKYGIKSTFFFTGYIVNLYPELVSMVVNAGHEVGSHGKSHLKENAFDVMPYERQLRHLVETKKQLEDLSGQEVLSFRAPALRVSTSTAQALIEAVLPGSKNTVKMGIGVQQNREQEYSKNGNKNTVISINIINQGLHCIINKKQDCDGLKNKITYHYVSRDSQAS